MILKLNQGESVEYICKIGGITVSELERVNGFIPKVNQYFYIPCKKKYVIRECDNLLLIQKRTGLSAEEIIKRVTISAGKVFYY